MALDALLRFGFLLLLINDFGFSLEMDSYLAAQSIPLFGTALILVFTQNAALPACHRIDERALRHGTVIAIFLLVMAILTPLYLLYYSLAGSLFSLLPLFAGGITEHPDFIALSGVFCLVSIGQCAIHVGNVHYHAAGRFFVPEIASSLAGILCILAYLLIDVDSPLQAAWIFLGRCIAHFSLLLVCSKIRSVHWPAWQTIRDILLSYRALFFSSLVYKSNVIWDRVFTALCGEGAVTVYHLLTNIIEPGIRIYERIIKPITVTRAQPMLERLERNLAIYSLLPMIAFSLILVPAVILLGRGWLEPIFLKTGISWATFSMLLWVMTGLIVGGGMGSFLGSLYVGTGQQDRLAQITLVCFPLSVVARYAGASLALLPGFATVTSLYYVLMGIVQWRLLERKPEPVHA